LTLVGDSGKVLLVGEINKRGVPMSEHNELVIAVSDHLGLHEIHAAGCSHLRATIPLYAEGGPRIPKWDDVIDAAAVGETIEEIEANWAAFCGHDAHYTFISKVAACARKEEK